MKLFWSDCLHKCNAIAVGDDEPRKRNLDNLNFLSLVHRCSDPNGAALTARCHLCAYLTIKKKKRFSHVLSVSGVEGHV